MILYISINEFHQILTAESIQYTNFEYSLQYFDNLTLYGAKNKNDISIKTKEKRDEDT